MDIIVDKGCGVDVHKETVGNSLVPILPAGHRDISLNCYTAQLGPLPYLQ